MWGPRSWVFTLRGWAERESPRSESPQCLRAGWSRLTLFGDPGVEIRHLGRLKPHHNWLALSSCRGTALLVDLSGHLGPPFLCFHSLPCHVNCGSTKAAWPQ
jgi:hypothetical protein